jgi:hypothetical protein
LLCYNDLNTEAIITHFKKRCNSLDKDLQTYYEDRFSTMATAGWAQFIEDVQALYDSYDKINSVATHDEFLKRKGQIDILQWVLSLKEVSSQSYEELQDADTA